MIIRIYAIVAFCCIMLAGCTHDQVKEAGPASLEQDGWTRLGQVTVPYERDEDIVGAGHAISACGSIRFEADGPAQIHRIIVTYGDGSVYLPEQGLAFDGAGNHILSLPGTPRPIDRVALVYSGGRLMRKTVVTLWTK